MRSRSATGKRLVEPSGVPHGVGAGEQGGDGERHQLTAPQALQGGGIPRVLPRSAQQSAAAGEVLEDRADRHDVTIAAQNGELLGELVRIPEIVGVQEGHELTPGEGETTITGTRDSPVDAPVDPDTLVGDALGDRRSAVRGPVVHHDDVQLPMRLVQDGRETRLDVLLRVVQGDDH